MPVSTNFRLEYEFSNQKGRVYGDWPARIVLKKTFVSGTEAECTFVPEPSVSESEPPARYAPNDLLLVDWEGKLQHVGHVA
jgi:hypothetical protein